MGFEELKEIIETKHKDFVFVEGHYKSTGVHANKIKNLYWKITENNKECIC